MRSLIPVALCVGGSAAAAFQLPFNIGDLFTSSASKATNTPASDAGTAASAPPRIAIIGAGAGGSSAAFWLGKAKERYGLDVEIDIYDKASYIGGRSTTVQPYDDDSYPPVELGASVFIPVNKNMWRASSEWDLSRTNFEEEEGAMGIWDGESFVIQTSTVGGTVGSWIDTAKIIWRYGMSAPRNTRKLVKEMTDKYVGLYTSTPPKWTNISDLVSEFGWTGLTSQTGTEYFTSNGVSKRFANEFIDAMTRVNYCQNADNMHAMVTACSFAAGGASSVSGGNWQIFWHFVEDSNANVFLDTTVTALKRTSSSHWTLHTSAGTSQTYRAVILAAPFHSTSISLPTHLAELIPPQPYHHMHVTILTTTAPGPNPAYFGLGAHGAAPKLVLTTREGERNGGKAPEFNALNYMRKLRKYSGNTTAETDEWVVKIFSLAPLSDEWLADMFQGQVGWLLRKEWDAYPVLPPTTTFPPVKLDQGLFYVNAFEPFISTMETETVASRNVVDLLLAEEFDAAICPPRAASANGTEARAKDDESFVYGWDC
ncbi:FAD/NAD(P)-binding domain-containing protein [Auriscalpium vulgare]|uniref:FAD/NAD(P)-binding domain-containing protein n=1 Tax=Auriscalpium vulgare TaxID=40419 RepID=A0ACB8RJ09_9AGAM|nr:FAD/NAD(P)-binding domain-containing protein [Auriscalpium vulgare]